MCEKGWGKKYIFGQTCYINRALRHGGGGHSKQPSHSRYSDLTFPIFNSYKCCKCKKLCTGNIDKGHKVVQERNFREHRKSCRLKWGVQLLVKVKELITICLSIDRVSVLSGASGRSKTTSQLEAASKLPWYRGVTCKDIKDITPTVLILLGMFYRAF